ncbi:hypothetical protein TNIN_160041, partial [Trichonephila inaurata madagascariensis]
YKILALACSEQKSRNWVMNMMSV